MEEAQKTVWRDSGALDTNEPESSLSGGKSDSLDKGVDASEPLALSQTDDVTAASSPRRANDERPSFELMSPSASSELSGNVELSSASETKSKLVATPATQSTTCASALSPVSLSPSPASSECQQTLAALNTIFSKDEGGENCDYLESQLGVMMEQTEARELFLQALDEKRGAASLSRRGFDLMAMAMTAVLNASLQSDDVKCAMRVANMANTFYCERESGDVSDAESDDSLGAAEIVGEVGTKEILNSATQEAASEDSASTVSVSTPDKVPVGPSSTSSNAHSCRKKYLQREPSIRHHKWWASDGFWEKALLEGIGLQMALRPPVHWEDLSQESLREAVLGK